MGTVNTGVRFYAQGSELVRKDMDQIADSGKRMWAGIASGNVVAMPGVRMLNAGVGELNNGMNSLAANAGVATPILSSIGPAGIAAAAGIGALVLASHQAVKAMDFAADIGDSAQKIYVSTDALQAYRYMVEQTGGSAQEADAALQKFTGTFGTARAGNQRSLKWFEALGFSQADLQQVKSGEEMLPEIARRIANLSSTAEQAGIADKLGLTAMLPAIRESNGAIDVWIQKARDAGVIMDAGMVKKGKEAEDQFRSISQVIKVQLSQAFISLAPLIVSATTLLSKLVQKFGEFIDKYRAIENRSTQSLIDRQAQLTKENNDLVAKYGLGEMLKAPTGKTTQVMNPLISGPQIIQDQIDAARDKMLQNSKELGQINEELAKRKQESMPPEAPTGTGELNLPQPDKSAQQQKRFLQELQRAESETLQARQSIAPTIDQQLQIELQRLAAEKTARDAEIAAQVKTKDLTQAQGDRLIAAEEAAYEAKVSAAQEKTSRERTKVDEKFTQDMSEEKTAELKAQEDLTLTARQKLALELSILEIERENQRNALQQSFAAGGENANLSPDQQSTLLKNFDAETSRQRASTVRESGTDLGDFTEKTVYTSLHDAVHDAFSNNENFLKSLFGGIAKTFAEKMEDDLADTLYDGLDGLLKQLFSSYSGGSTGGSSGSSWMSAAMQSLGAAFGFASGGEQTPGMTFRAAEHGTELALIGRSGRVFDHAETASMLQEAANSAASASGVAVNASFSPVYNVTGTSEEMSALKKQMRQDRDEFEARVRSTVNDGISRRTIKTSAR